MRPKVKTPRTLVNHNSLDISISVEEILPEQTDQCIRKESPRIFKTNIDTEVIQKDMVGKAMKKFTKNKRLDYKKHPNRHTMTFL